MAKCEVNRCHGGSDAWSQRPCTWTTDDSRVAPVLRSKPALTICSVSTSFATCLQPSEHRNEKLVFSSIFTPSNVQNWSGEILQCLHRIPAVVDATLPKAGAGKVLRAARQQRERQRAAKQCEAALLPEAMDEGYHPAAPMT